MAAHGFTFMGSSGVEALVAALITSAILDRDERWLRAFGYDFIDMLAHTSGQTDRYYALALTKARR